MKIDYVGERRLSPAHESWAWSKGPTVNALADLADLLETTPEHVDGLLKQARQVRTAVGGNYAAEFAVGPARTLLIHYAGGRGYRWVFREGTTDGSTFYREFDPVYARYRVAQQRHNELLELQEQLEVMARAAEIEKQAAFDAWERAGQPHAPVEP
jgi:hypothetical protein